MSNLDDNSQSQELGQNGCRVAFYGRKMKKRYRGLKAHTRHDFGTALCCKWNYSLNLWKRTYSSWTLGTRDPLCSSNVANILSTGVAISKAFSDAECANPRFLQTFNERSFARRLSDTSSSSTHSSPSSISPWKVYQSGLICLLIDEMTLHTGSGGVGIIRIRFNRNVMITSLFDSNASGANLANWASAATRATGTSDPSLMPLAMDCHIYIRSQSPGILCGLPRLP